MSTPGEESADFLKAISKLVDEIKNLPNDQAMVLLIRRLIAAYREGAVEQKAQEEARKAEEEARRHKRGAPTKPENINVRRARYMEDLYQGAVERFGRNPFSEVGWISILRETEPVLFPSTTASNKTFTTSISRGRKELGLLPRRHLRKNSRTNSQLTSLPKPHK